MKITNIAQLEDKLVMLTSSMEKIDSDSYSISTDLSVHELVSELLRGVSNYDILSKSEYYYYSSLAEIEFDIDSRSSISLIVSNGYDDDDFSDYFVSIRYIYY